MTLIVAGTRRRVKEILALEGLTADEFDAELEARVGPKHAYDMGLAVHGE